MVKVLVPTVKVLGEAKAAQSRNDERILSTVKVLNPDSFTRHLNKTKRYFKKTEPGKRYPCVAAVGERIERIFTVLAEQEEIGEKEVKKICINGVRKNFQNFHQRQRTRTIPPAQGAGAARRTPVPGITFPPHEK